MSVEIKAIEHTRKGLKPFVKFGIDLYKGNGCYVPPLVLDEIETLSPSGNPAFEFCRAQAFMAYRDGKPVGRIAAIINEVVNNRTGRDECRFGFVRRRRRLGAREWHDRDGGTAWILRYGP